MTKKYLLLPIALLSVSSQAQTWSNEYATEHGLKDTDVRQDTYVHSVDGAGTSTHETQIHHDAIQVQGVPRDRSSTSYDYDNSYGDGGSAIAE